MPSETQTDTIYSMFSIYQYRDPSKEKKIENRKEGSKVNLACFLANQYWLRVVPTCLF